MARQSVKGLAAVTLARQDGVTATFDVAYTGREPRGNQDDPRYSLWLRLDGLDASGVRASSSEAAVSDWVGGVASVQLAKPDTGGGHRAYVWLFPDPETPVSNTVEF